MKEKKNPAGIIVAAVLVVVVGAVIWLARAPLMPTVQTVQQTIPDDHIPR